MFDACSVQRKAPEVKWSWRWCLFCVLWPVALLLCRFIALMVSQQKHTSLDINWYTYEVMASELSRCLSDNFVSGSLIRQGYRNMPKAILLRNHAMEESNKYLNSVFFSVVITPVHQATHHVPLVQHVYVPTSHVVQPVGTAIVQSQSIVVGK